MKNETNKQHTPAPWIVSENKLSVVTADKSVIIAHAKNNTDAIFIARAPELLKENEQLKLQNEAYEEREINNFKVRDNYRSINIELTETSKALLADVLDLLQKMIL